MRLIADFSRHLNCLLRFMMLLASLHSLPVHATAPVCQFRDEAQRRGIVFAHHSPFTPERHLHLTMGSGVAWIDIDRDGWPDLLLGQGRAWKNGDFDPADGAPTDRVFRNCAGMFFDITSSAGLVLNQYTMGLAVGDVDNDGFPDLYVSAFGRNRLSLNQGDGTFRDVSETAGVDLGGYSASCTWTDIDSDGLLDLYVTRYLDIDLAKYATCNQTRLGKSAAIPCPPRKYPWPSDRLFLNLGDGRFADVTRESGIATLRKSAALGVVTGDWNRDGALDLYVANDTTDNFLLMNDGKGRFRDDGLISGTSVNRVGEPEAGMGVAAGDADGDGLVDLFVTNYYGESNTLYRNAGQGQFVDITDEAGLAAVSRTRLGFGTLLLDVDNDTRLDLFVANGHISDRLGELGLAIPFRQCPQLLWNDRGRRFVDISDLAGRTFQSPSLGRGCAAADFDRDGRVDIALSNLNGPAQLLRNTSFHQTRSLTLDLVGVRTCRDATGAEVSLVFAAGKIVRWRDGSTSYLSCSDSRLTIGTGSETAARRVEVRWPGGRRIDVWHNVSCENPLTLVEGRGEAAVEGSLP